MVLLHEYICGTFARVHLWYFCMSTSVVEFQLLCCPCQLLTECAVLTPCCAVSLFVPQQEYSTMSHRPPTPPVGMLASGGFPGIMDDMHGSGWSGSATYPAAQMRQRNGVVEPSTYCLSDTTPTARCVSLAMRAYTR